MYPPHHLGGYELIWRGAVEHLRERGHAIRILTTGYRDEAPDPALPEDPDCHRELGWYWSDHAFPRMSPLARMRLERHNLRVLDRHRREFAPDLVAWWSMGGMSMSMIEDVSDRDCPSLAVVMDDWPSYGPAVDGWQRLVRRLRAPGIAERATRIPTLGDLAATTRWLFISEAQRRRVEGFIGPLPGARVANAGVDTRLFTTAPEHDWRWRLLYCGRIDARKGIDRAIRALALLPDRATLRIVGGGDEHHRAELAGLADDLGVSEQVSFERVPRDALPAIFAADDVLLFPVVWDEPWGLVPLEAMAVGMQVVASGRGGSGEYLRDRENCLVAAEPEQIAAAVTRLAEDPGLRHRLRSGARETAARYPASAFADGVERAAHEAVRRG